MEKCRPRVVLGLSLLFVLHGCSRPELELELFEQLWSDYKTFYILPEGAVLDRTDQRVTSEGQSYALLRAAWMGDAPTFERVFHWTEQNLKRPEDGLYSWFWSPGEGRVLDRNTAADADQDIAFALIIASAAFARPDYLDRARLLLGAIRTHESLQVEGGWFPSAGNWAGEERVTNLSYFAPYAYPYFHRTDPEGNWMAALETGYRLLAEVRSRTRLIPDFIIVHEDGGVDWIPEHSPLSGEFSFDAMRIFWRVAMDCLLHGRVQACADPAGTADTVRLLARDGAIFTRYSPDGTPLQRTESLSFYGSLLPALSLSHPAAAEAVRRSRLSPHSLETVRRDPNRYYDLNWIWFGLAADRGFLTARTPPLESVPR